MSFFPVLAMANGFSSSRGMRVVEHVFPDWSVATLALDAFQSSFVRLTILVQMLSYTLRVVVSSSISNKDRNKGYSFWY